MSRSLKKSIDSQNNIAWKNTREVSSQLNFQEKRPSVQPRSQLQKIDIIDPSLKAHVSRDQIYRTEHTPVKK